MNFRSLLPDVEAAAVRSWPALETTSIAGWLWRHSSGGSKRANSVATLAFDGSDLDAAIGRVEALSFSRGAAACFMVSDASAPVGLDDRLEALDYRKGDPHVTLAKAVTPLARLDGVDVSSRPSDGWMTAYLSSLSESRRLVASRLIAQLPRSARFLSVVHGGAVTSSGLTVGDGEFASVQCMASVPTARRRGGAKRILAAIEHLASNDRRRTIYLQAGADNTTALALYQNAGFIWIGNYHTRTARAQRL